ncbi:MAG: DnaA N-terminal domain-containing protein, partial [Akkermansiaceae bacterium]|nr:DnaA N-terminal domain-containing protein [Akkermansiaceae bacterium]
MKQADALFDDQQGSTTKLNQKGEAIACEGHGKLWAEVSGALKDLVSGDAFVRWFSSAYLKEVNETEAVLGVVSDMHQVWIETNYLPEVQAALASVSPLPLKVRVVVCEAIVEQLSEAEPTAADARANQLSDTAVSELDATSQASFSEGFGVAAANSAKDHTEEQIRKKLRSTG